MNSDTTVKMTFKPLGKRVVLKKQTEKVEKKGNIYLPTKTTEDNNHATVIALGPECKENLKVNDSVMYENYAGQEFKYNDNTYIVLSIDSIVTKIK